MIALVRAELLKVRTTRTTLGLVIGMVALILLITFGVGYGSDDQFLSERSNQFELLAEGSIASAFAALLGVMSLTTEVRHGTIRPTFLAEPRRVRVVGAKIAAGALAGVALGAAGVGLSFAIGRFVLGSRNIPFALDGSDVALVIGGGIAAAALWGAFGVGLGAALRNQVGAIIGLLVWVLLVENILFAIFPGQARYLPVHAANALTSIDVDHQLGVAAGALLFVAYCVVAGVAGAVVNERRDVP